MVRFKSLQFVIDSCAEEYGTFSPETFSEYVKDNAPFTLTLTFSEFDLMSEFGSEILMGMHEILNVNKVLYDLETELIHMYDDRTLPF